MDKLKSPQEPEFTLPLEDNAPKYLLARAALIRSQESWWENLPKFKLGWDIFNMTKELGYRNVILTAGPRKNPAAWSGKKKCFDRNLGTDFDTIIARDKSLVYGKVLVDDYLPYVQKWLIWRPRGLVIMPKSNWNYKIDNPQIIVYDGTNLEQVREALEKAKLRNEYITTK